MIRAECHSDDRRVEVDFDATPWFEVATGAEIRALAQCGHSADYPADRVAQHMASVNPAVKRLFDYLDIVGDCGFECYVNGEDAERWLQGYTEDKPAF